jgi:hypothetical protein
MPFQQEILGTYRGITNIEEFPWIGEIELVITNTKVSVRIATGSTESISFQQTERLTNDDLHELIWESLWIYAHIEEEIFWNAIDQNTGPFHQDKYSWYHIPGGAVLLINKMPRKNEFWLLIIDIEGTSVLYSWWQVMDWKFNALVESLLKKGKIVKRL